jgi:hypothetical protein
VYQVWDKDNANNLNDKRSVQYVPAKIWVRAFKEANEKLEKENKPLFTPTTIMETDDGNYAFVIHKAYFDRRDRIVFTISTKEISLSNNCSKDLIKIPCGKLNNVRFDIDDETAVLAGVTSALIALAASLAFLSDYRIKTDVETIEDTNKLYEMNPVSYYNKINKRKEYGFIAHELARLYPELVNGEKDGKDYQTVDYISIIALIVKEIQSLKKKITV